MYTLAGFDLTTYLLPIGDEIAAARQCTME
jgi:hypothetical protein